MATDDYTQDGPLAREIAQVIPYFPFKGIPRFYDVGGLLASPTHFQKVVDILAARYGDLKIDAIGGFDARGFLFTPVALALNKPFFMLRKKGKMPNTIYGEQYTKEYAGSDCLGIPRGAVKPGDRVLLIDDLVATGGTLTAGVELVEAQGATVVECACMVELKFLEGAKKVQSKFPHANVWGFISEDILLNEAKLPDGYEDDGEAH